MRTELIKWLLEQKKQGKEMNVFQGVHELGLQKDLPRKGPQGEMFHGVEMWKKLNNIK
jgi:hypothetical protein|tara:strand:+ start:1033 stop:1206 length:174 start_codon:yes stop_codon:yes gene_type:complete